jgi:hypothetical protein
MHICGFLISVKILTISDLDHEVDDEPEGVYEDEEIIEPVMTKKLSEKSIDSEDDVNMIFPHLNKKMHPVMDEDKNNPYKVFDPVIKGSHVSYTIKGIDNDGPFEGNRRYTDFLQFRNALVARWPGVYFPPIPPKKTVGNKEMKFVEERRYFLEQFLRKLALSDFILISEEFKIFSRLTGDIKKSLNFLPKLTPFAILDRFKSNFNISEEQSSDDMLMAKANIKAFDEFSNKILPVLDLIKAQVKALAPTTQEQKDEYLEFLQMLEDYEYNDLMVTTKIPEHKLIVNSKSCHSIKKKIKQ